MSISALFERVGAPLVNTRWSWGGVRQDGTVVLRVWQNETKRINGQLCIQLTHHQVFVGKENDLGYQERQRQLEQVKAGARCYMVMCVPRSTTEEPRVIREFNNNELFLAGDLVEDGGDVWAPIAAREAI